MKRSSALGEAAGATTALVTVVRLDTRAVIPDAQVQVLAIFGDIEQMATTSPPPFTTVASGVTDDNGVYPFSSLTLPDTPLWYRIVVSSAFPTAFVDVQQGSATEPIVGLCPPGIDPVVCEISLRQFKMAQQLALLNAQWGGQVSKATWAAAHAYLENLDGGPKDSRLKEYWINDLSWGLMDLAIPPLDWPVILQGYKAMRTIFDAVPYPTLGGGKGKEYFKSCCSGVPVWKQSTNDAPLGPLNYRLFSPTFSTYWPRTDTQIRQDLAGHWFMGIGGIFACTIKAVISKMKDVQRQAKAWAFMGSLASFYLAPLTGGATFVTMLTSGVEMVTVLYDVGADEAEVGLAGLEVLSGLTLVTGGSPEAKSLISGGLALALNSMLPEDFNATLRAILMKAIPEITDAAIATFTSDSASTALMEGGIPSIEGLVSLQSLEGLFMGQMVSMISGMMKAVGARKVKDFYNIAMDLQNLPEKSVPFLMWCFEVLFFDILISAAAQDAGLEGLTGDPKKDALGPLQEQAALLASTVSGGLSAGSSPVGVRAAVGVGVPSFLITALLALAGGK